MWSLYISFHNHNIQAGTGKFIYKVSILDENTSFLNGIIKQEGI